MNVNSIVDKATYRAFRKWWKRAYNEASFEIRLAKKGLTLKAVTPVEHLVRSRAQSIVAKKRHTATYLMAMLELAKQRRPSCAA